MCFVSLFLINNQILRAQQPVSVSVQLDSAGYLIGDYIGLTITISHPYQMQIGLSDVAQRLNNEFEMIRQVTNDSIRQENFLTEQKKYLITSFDTGWLRIPPMVVYYQTSSGKYDSALSDPLPVYVGTVAVDPAKGARPIKPILVSKNENRWQWILAAAFLSIGGISFYYWYRIQQKRKKLRPKKIEPPKPPYQRAKENLELLEQEQLWQKGITDQYYSRLTHILREYVEETLKVPALEITSIEMLKALRKKLTDKVLLDQLSRDLVLADFVKFARMQVLDEDHQRVMQTIREFIEQTKPEPIVENTTTPV